MIARSAAARTIVVASALIAATAGSSSAQRGRGGEGTPSASPRAGAPIDLTGYWVAIVTEDWANRMVMPARGDFVNIPLNERGRSALDSWDPAKDEERGDQCRSYGAAGIMRVPGRVHITWNDDAILKIETDAGEQTRLLHFRSPPPAGPRQWQGVSAASWAFAGGRGLGGREGPPRGGTLKVITTNLRAGYLRKNGVPYSENATVTEYFDHFAESGREWFVVTTIVDDPTYLTQPFITSSNFRKEPDGSKWRPVPCTSR